MISARLLVICIAGFVLSAAPARAAVGAEISSERWVSPAPPVMEARLSTSATKTLLRQKGYTDIGQIQLTGGVYRVWARDPWGRKVELIVDPDTARILRKFYPK